MPPHFSNWNLEFLQEVYILFYRLVALAEQNPSRFDETNSIGKMCLFQFEFFFSDLWPRALRLKRRSFKRNNALFYNADEELEEILEYLKYNFDQDYLLLLLRLMATVVLVPTL